MVEIIAVRSQAILLVIFTARDTFVGVNLFHLLGLALFDRVRAVCSGVSESNTYEKQDIHAASHERHIPEVLDRVSAILMTACGTTFHEKIREEWKKDGPSYLTKCTGTDHADIYLPAIVASTEAKSCFSKPEQVDPASLAPAQRSAVGFISGDGSARSPGLDLCMG